MRGTSPSILGAVLLGAVLLGGLGACSSEPVSPGADATVSPDATEPYDAGTEMKHDAGARTDGGRRDGGFADPDTILEGAQTIAGISTWVQILGTMTSTLPPVLVLHDGPGLGHEYLPDQLRFLAPGRMLVFYDMRASGQTSWGSTTVTTTITAERHALDVADLVEWVGTKHDATKVDLVGHGYGAAVAALYAAANPAKVDRLVLVTPYPLTVTQLADFNGEESSRLTTSERSLENALQEGPTCHANVNQCSLELWRIHGPHYLCPENAARFFDMTFLYDDFRVEDFVERDLRNRQFDWRPTFAAIRAATTVVSGPCDPIPAATAEDYASSISGASHVVLTNSGHFPFVEERPAFEAAVSAALRR